MDEPDDFIIAIHEAGHAVAYVVVGLGCGRCELGSWDHDLLGPALGRTDCAATPDLAGRGEAPALPFLTGLAAGAAAVRLLIGDDAGPPGDAGDLTAAACLASTALRESSEPGGPSTYKPVDEHRHKALLAYACAQAEGLVCAYDRAIRATADRLLESRVLSGSEVAAIVAEHPPRDDIAEPGAPVG